VLIKVCIIEILDIVEERIAVNIHGITDGVKLRQELVGGAPIVFSTAVSIINVLLLTISPLILPSPLPLPSSPSSASCC
jgi:hypothetical protein